MKNESKFNIILIINILIVISSIIFAVLITSMVFSNSCLEIKEQYIDFKTGIIAENIETGIELGMDINNYYGISDIGEELTYFENIDAVIINTEGEPVEYTFKGEENEAQKLALIYSDKFLRNIKGESEFIDIDNKRLLLKPISIDEKFAYIVIIYDKKDLYKIEGLNLINDYKSVVNNISMLTSQSIRDKVREFYNKGMKPEDIINYADYYSNEFKDFRLIKGVKFGFNINKDSEFEIIENAFNTDEGEFSVKTEIDNEYINKIYVLLLLTIIASLIVCIMIVIEVSSLSKIAGNVIKKDNSKDVMPVIIKFFTFFTYVAVYTSLPYGASIIRSNGISLLGIPISILIALPVSLESGAIFIFLVLGPYILKKIGIKPYMAITLISGIVPAVICALYTNIFTVLFCSFSFGVCIGLQKYFMNYLIPLFSDNENEIRINFGFYNGGLLTGLTLGGSLGGVIVAAKGYGYVYIASAAIMLFLFLVLIIFMPYEYIAHRRKNYNENTEVKNKPLETLKELFKRPRLLLNMVFTCVPLNLGLMFIVSFLPVLIDIKNMSSLVGTYGYLLYGITGNYLGILMLKKLKNTSERVSGFIGMLLIGISVFILIPKLSILTLIISAGLAGLFDGYGSASITGVLVNSKESKGIDKSMLLSVMSITGSIVCTASPVIYGVALNNGNMTINLFIIFIFFVISGLGILKIKE